MDCPFTRDKSKKEVTDMHSITLKLDQATIQKMTNHYQKYLQPLIPHSQLRVKINQTTITAYHTGKVLFQGPQAESEAKLWQDQSDVQPRLHQAASSLPSEIAQWTLIGSDEVGNGSYFGPLTVCAVYLDKDQQKAVRKLGVQDSKKLSDQQIHQIAQQLIQTVPYHLTIVNPHKYNQLTQSYHANAIKVKLHDFTLQKLRAKLSKQEKDDLQGILIDQFTPKKNYYQLLGETMPDYQPITYFAQKAESIHLAVACASIIARDAFVQGLIKLGADYQVRLPSGANPPVDQFAARLVAEHGQEVLNQTAKLHFANTQKALKIAQKLAK